MNKITKILMMVGLVLSVGNTVQAQYSGGTGDASDPYLISTPEQMNEIGLYPEDWDKNFKLIADIDLGSYAGTEFNIIGDKHYDGGWVGTAFTGVFDGNNHKISNFTWTSTDRFRIGIFGDIDDPTAEIRNLGLISPDVDAGTGAFIGSLVGVLRDGNVTNCYVESGSVTGDYAVGGLVGSNVYGTIVDCYATGSVKGTSYYVAGLVGSNFALITNCYAVGSVEGYVHVGGLVGGNHGDSIITNCYATGSLTGSDDVGGLVGCNYGYLENCYASGDVEANYHVGGLVGSNDDNSIITKCYATGSVTGNTDVGGLVGAESGTTENSFWDTETSGLNISAGGRGKTTEQMQSSSTFYSWGVCSEGVWTIDEGNDYPRLAWQNLPGVPIINPDPIYGGGGGTEAEPYLIYTAEQLNTIGLVPCHWDKNFILMADIDLSEFDGQEGRPMFNIIAPDTGYSRYSFQGTPFTGVFDGNGHTISKFTYSSTNTYYIGLCSPNYWLAE